MEPDPVLIDPALIDFGTIGTFLGTIAVSAIGAAILVGGAVLVARMGWKFFKSFTA